MAASIVNPERSGLATYEDNGGGTGAQHVIIDSGGASATVTTTVTASVVAVSTISATALAANASRTGATFVNNGASDVTLRRGTPAVAGTGIILKASGGSYEINSTNLYRGILTCITASGTSSLAVEEGV